MNTSCPIAGARFEAARQVSGAIDQTARLHGHSFRVTARADAPNLGDEQLHEALLNIVKPLDYSNLNHELVQCDDISLATHLSASIPHPVILNLQSSPQRGVIVDGKLALNWIQVRFEAAHQLPYVPAGHKCGRLHGHSFSVRFFVEARLSSHPRLEASWGPLFLELNHRYLNDISGLSNPTSEVLAKWLYHRISATLPGLAWVEVSETPSSGSQFDGRRFRIWKDQYFESSLPLGDKSSYTGHSYMIRLMLSGDMDQAMGWLMDFGDIKERFNPIYRQLDHHPLDQLSGVKGTDSVSVAEWVHAHLFPLLPELARIDLMKQEERGVSLMFRNDMRWPML